MPKLKYFITVIESERGWGQKQETWEYDTFEDAQDAINRINEDNQKQWERDHFVPDWWIMVRGGVQVKEV